jgi:hypothetical protein
LVKVGLVFAQQLLASGPQLSGVGPLVWLATKLELLPHSLEELAERLTGEARKRLQAPVELDKCMAGVFTLCSEHFSDANLESTHKQQFDPAVGLPAYRSTGW